MLILGVVVLRNAWVCDDAYISFRVVDNFVNGYGLTWNTAERVQAFTNPLWVLLVSAFYMLSGEAYYTSIFLSLALTLAAAIILVRKTSLSSGSAAVGLVILICSKAFIDYSTSGLENALTHFLLAVFVACYFSRESSARTLFWLSLIASLGMVNRLDCALLYLPALVYMFFRVPKKPGLLYWLAGSSPLLIWGLFSVVYYGFALPNTYYAKLQAGIPTPELIAQGLLYYVDTLHLDPLTLVVIMACFVLVLVSRFRRALPLLLGVALYLLYVVRIGGDFMTGRFFSAPLFMSVLLLSRYRIPLSGPGLWAPVLTVLLLGLTSPRPPLLNQGTYGDTREGGVSSRGIADERAWYYQFTGLLLDSRGKTMPAHPGIDIGRAARKEPAVVRCSAAVGFEGYASGPDIHLLDQIGLADPLLARLPTSCLKGWRIGHFPRAVPVGYIRTLETGDNCISDSSLAEYYEKLAVLTRSGVWSGRRFVEIFKFNIGNYENLRLAYTGRSAILVDYADVREPKQPRTRWDARGNLILEPDREVRVLLDSVYHHDRLEISVDNNDFYYVTFERDGVQIAESIVDAQPAFGLRTDTLEIQPAVCADGYDCITVRPWKGDGLYSMGHLRLFEHSAD